MPRAAAVLLPLLCATAVAGGTAANTVRWAPSWDAAVREARALNLPLVIHRHGFT